MEFSGRVAQESAMTMMKAAVFVEPGQIVIHDKLIPDASWRPRPRRGSRPPCDA